MRKFLKLLLNFNLITILVIPSVVSCTKEGIDLKDIATDLNLGYLKNLNKETIENAFAQKNPKVNMKLVQWGFGNSYKGSIGPKVPYTQGYKASRVHVYYTSKLGFGNTENNEFSILFTKKDQKFTVPIQILTDNYNEKIDGQIHFYGTTFFLKFEEQIDQTSKIYNITLSLDPNKDKWIKDLVYSISFKWGDVTLATIKAMINFEA